MVERVVSGFGVGLCLGVVTGTLRFLLRPIVIEFERSHCLRVVIRRLHRYAPAQEGEEDTITLSFRNIFRAFIMSFIAGHN